MARYQVEERVVREVELSPKDVLTVAEAAEWLGVSVQAVSQRLNRGNLTTVLNPKANQRQGRRLLLRSEVEALVKGRGR